MTALQLSLAHTVVVIGNEEVTGWSDDSDALMMPMDDDFFTVMTGADGRILAVNNGKKGGEVTVKLLPNSPSTAYYLPFWYQIYNNNAIIQWNGYVEDRRNGLKFGLRDGVMLKGPQGMTLGNAAMSNYMFTWYFQTIEIDIGLNAFRDESLPASTFNIPQDEILVLGSSTAT